MKKELIHIRGQFTGDYCLGEGEGLSDRVLSEINWTQIIVKESDVIKEYNSDVFKVGNFQHHELLPGVLVEAEPEQFMKVNLHDTILNNIEILSTAESQNGSICKVTGVLYGTIIKFDKTELAPIKEKEVEEPEEVIDAEVEDDDFLVDSYVEPRTQSRGVSRFWSGGMWKYLMWPLLIAGSGLLFFGFTPLLVGALGVSSLVGINKAYGGGNRARSGGASQSIGCLRPIFGILAFLALLFILYYGYQNGFGSISWLILAVVLFIVFTFFDFVGSLLGLLLGVGFLIFIGSLIMSLLGDLDDSEWIKDDDREDEEELVETEEWVDTMQVDDIDTAGIAYFIHNHDWENNYGEDFEETFKVQQKFFSISKNERNNFEVNVYQSDVWTQIYSNIVNNDKDKLNELISMYSEIQKKESLDRRKFADMVVASIQHIPYVLVHESSCYQASQQGGFAQEYHSEGKPCIAEIKYGIQSPVEFMSNFKGDCDTRSVLCFLILSKFGYDTAVLVSNEYGHSILGIADKIGGGDHVKYRGKRYYVWETTATDWKAGNIPPGCSNLRYWDVALAN
jgi:hypothetical protein